MIKIVFLTGYLLLNPEASNNGVVNIIQMDGAAHNVVQMDGAAHNVVQMDGSAPKVEK